MAGLFTLNAAIWWQISLEQLEHLIGLFGLINAASSLFYLTASAGMQTTKTDWPTFQLDSADISRK